VLVATSSGSLSSLRLTHRSSASSVAIKGTHAHGYPKVDGRTVEATHVIRPSPGLAAAAVGAG